MGRSPWWTAGLCVLLSATAGSAAAQTGSQNRLEELRADAVVQMREDIATIKATLAKLQSSPNDAAVAHELIDELRKALDAATRERDALAATVQQLNAQIAADKAAQAEQSRRIAEAQSALDGAIKSVDGARAELAAQLSTVQKAEAERNGRNEAALKLIDAGLLRIEQSNTAQMDQLASRNTAATTEALTQLGKQRETLTAQIQALSTEVSGRLGVAEKRLADADAASIAARADNKMAADAALARIDADAKRREEAFQALAMRVQTEASAKVDGSLAKIEQASAQRLDQLAEKNAAANADAQTKLAAQRDALTTKVDATRTESTARITAIESEVAAATAATAAARADNKTAIDSGLVKIEQASTAKLDQLAAKNTAANTDALAKLDAQREALTSTVNGVATDTAGKVTVLERTIADATAANAAARNDNKAAIDAGLAKIEQNSGAKLDQLAAKNTAANTDALAKLDVQREALTGKISLLEKTIADATAANAAARADNKTAIDAGLAKIDQSNAAKLDQLAAKNAAANTDALAKLDVQREALTSKINAVAADTAGKVSVLEKSIADVTTANAVARADNKTAIDAGLAKIDQSNSAKLDQLAAKNAAANTDALAKLDAQREALTTKINGVAADTAGKVSVLEKNIADATASNAAARADNKTVIDAGLARIEQSNGAKLDQLTAKNAAANADALAKLDTQREALTTKVNGVAADTAGKVSVLEKTIADAAAANAAARIENAAVLRKAQDDNRQAIDAGLAKVEQSSGMKLDQLAAKNAVANTDALAKLDAQREALTSKVNGVAIETAGKVAALEKNVADATTANAAARADNKTAIDAGLAKLDQSNSAKLDQLAAKNAAANTDALARLDAQREALTTKVNGVANDTTAKVSVLEKNIAEATAFNATARADNAAALKAARDENRAAIDAGLAKIEQGSIAKLDQLAAKNAAANTEAMTKLDVQREALTSRINGVAGETTSRVGTVERALAEVTAANAAARTDLKTQLDAGLARIDGDVRQRGEAQQGQIAKTQGDNQARLDAQREALTAKIGAVAGDTAARVAAVEKSVADNGASTAAARAENKAAIEAAITRLDGQLKQRGDTIAAQQAETSQQQSLRLAAVEKTTGEIAASNRTAAADAKAAVDAGLVRLDREQNTRMGEIEQKLAGSRTVDRQDVASTLRVVAEHSAKLASIEKALVDVTGAANAARSDAAQAAARSSTASQPAQPPAQRPAGVMAEPAVRCEQLDETHDDVWQAALLRLVPGARLLYTDFKTGLLWADVGGTNRSYPLAEARRAAGCP